MLRKISSKSKLKTRFALVQRLFLLAAWGVMTVFQPGRWNRNATVRQLKFATPTFLDEQTRKKVTGSLYLHHLLCSPLYLVHSQLLPSFSPTRAEPSRLVLFALLPRIDPSLNSRYAFFPLLRVPLPTLRIRARPLFPRSPYRPIAPFRSLTSRPNPSTFENQTTLRISSRSPSRPCLSHSLNNRHSRFDRSRSTRMDRGRGRTREFR